MGTGHSSYDRRAPAGQAPVDPEVARKAAIGITRRARNAGLDNAELLDLLGALGINELARPPRTRKARRR